MSAADRANEAASTSKAAAAPPVATRIPPSSGPANWPTIRAVAIRALAHGRLSGAASAGTIAPDAGTTGAVANAATNASASSAPGAPTTAMAAEHAAPSRSQATSTRRRSSRSLSSPDAGLTSAGTAKAMNRANPTQAAEPVRA
jgi:hypothetical protein